MITIRRLVFLIVCRQANCNYLQIACISTSSNLRTASFPYGWSWTFSTILPTTKWFLSAVVTYSLAHLHYQTLSLTKTRLWLALYRSRVCWNLHSNHPLDFSTVWVNQQNYGLGENKDTLKRNHSPVKTWWNLLVMSWDYQEISLETW